MANFKLLLGLGMTVVLLGIAGARVGLQGNAGVEGVRDRRAAGSAG